MQLEISILIFHSFQFLCEDELLFLTLHFQTKEQTILMDTFSNKRKAFINKTRMKSCIHTHSPTEIIISREKSTYKDLTNQRLDELSMHGINRSVNKSFETTVRVSLSHFFFQWSIILANQQLLLQSDKENVLLKRMLYHDIRFCLINFLNDPPIHSDGQLFLFSLIANKAYFSMWRKGNDRSFIEFWRTRTITK